MLLIITVLSLFAFASCDQAEVDAKRNELMDSANSVLEPFLKESEDSTQSSVDLGEMGNN